MKQNIRKRVTSMMITFALLVTTILTGIPAYADTLKTIALPAEPIASLPEGNLIYLGTQSATIAEENAKYTLPIYRTGDLTKPASVTIKSIDYSALYGKDYELLLDGVKKTGNGKTVLQNQFEGVKEADEATAASSCMNYSSALSSDKEKGEDTSGIINSLMDQLIPQYMNELEGSSETTISFAAGESEKTISFRLYNDSQSEGTETFALLLTDPKNAELYKVTSLSVTIEDDEPSVKSRISFAKKSYDADNGSVTVQVNRKGAEYSLCDVIISTAEGSARAGTNYREISSTLTFLPYQTERTFDIPVAGSGSFSVLLKDFTGCEEGSCSKADININESNAGISLLSETGTHSFNLDIECPDHNKSKDYYVEYKDGDYMGKIYDGSVDPPLQVGNYLFSADAAHNNGIFSYDKSQMTGDKPNGLGSLRSEYVYNSDLFSNSYGKLEYLHTTCWKEGTVYTYARSKIPQLWYQYMIPDWTETENYCWGQRSRFTLEGDDYSQSTTIEGQFSRTQSKGELVFGAKGQTGSNWDATSSNRNVTPYIYAVDNDGNTPKSYVHFFGIAEMFKRFRVSVTNPQPLKYYNADSHDYVSATSMQLKMECGEELIGLGDTTHDILANDDENRSNLVITISNSMVNGVEGKFARVTGYSMRVGSGDTAVTKAYPEEFISYLNGRAGSSSDSSVLDYSSAAVEKEIEKINNTQLDTVINDGYFIDWIESFQPDVEKYGKGYLQRINFTPRIDYYDVSVTVLAPNGQGAGTFSNADLKLAPGETEKNMTFHAGDKLDLSVTPEDSSSYDAAGYQVSTDGGDHFNTITSQTSLFLEYGKNYMIRPVIAEKNNCIEITFESDEARANLEILNLIDQADLKSYDSVSGSEKLAGRNILQTDSDGKTLVDKMTPVPGNAYDISVIVKGSPSDANYVYRPTITDVMTGQKYNSQRLTFNARSDVRDNRFMVGIEKVAVSDLKTVNVSGSLITAYAPIRDTGTSPPVLGAEGYTVIMNNGQVEVSQKVNGTQVTSLLPASLSGTTGSDGSFAITGLKVKSGDLVPFYVTDGLNEGYMESFTVGSVTDTINAGVFALSYPTNAPRINNLTYTYGKSTNNQSTDSTQNSVQIFDDTLTIDAYADTKGRTLSKAIFTVYTVKGTEKRYEVECTAGNHFQLQLPKMTENLYNGDRIKVRLVDYETRTIELATPDDDGNTSTKVNIEYPTVDTGLVFFVENAINVPQFYDYANQKSKTACNVPLLGNATAVGSTGNISFSKSRWDNDTGYTLTVNIGGSYNDAVAPSTMKLQKAKSFLDTMKKANKERSTTAEDIILTEMELKDKEIDPSKTEDVAKEKEANAEAIRKQGDAEAKEAIASMDNKKWSIGACVMLAFNWVYNPEKNDYQFISGAVAVGVTGTYMQTWYYDCYGVPVFLNLSGTMQVNFTVNYYEDGLTASEFDSYSGNIANILNKQGTEDYTANLMLNGKIQAGTGVCGVLSVRGYVSVTLQFQLGLTDPPASGLSIDSSKSGSLIDAGGGMGIDLLVTSVDINIARFKEGHGVYNDSSGFSFFGGLIDLNDSNGNVQSNALAASSEAEPASSETISLRDYDPGTENLNAAEGSLRAAGSRMEAAMLTSRSEGAELNIIQDQAAERTRPTYLALNDDGSKRLVLYLANKDGVTQLHYRLFENGEWGPAYPVSADGTMDIQSNAIYTDGKVYIAWVNIGQTKDTDSVIDRLSNAGISAVVYDVETKTMGQLIQVASSQNKLLSTEPHLTESDGQVFCSYIERDLQKAADKSGATDAEKAMHILASAPATITVKRFTDNTFSESINTKNNKYTFVSPQVTSTEDSKTFTANSTDFMAAAQKINGVNYVFGAFSHDMDGNITYDPTSKTNTSTDREIFLQIYDATNGHGYYPIQITHNNETDSLAQLNKVGGQTYLTWISDSTEIHILNVSDLVESITDSRLNGLYTNGYMTSGNLNKDWYKKDADAVKNALKTEASTPVQVGSTGYNRNVDYITYEDSIFDRMYRGQELCSDHVSLTGSRDSLFKSSISEYAIAGSLSDLYVFYTDYGVDDKTSTVTGRELFGVHYSTGLYSDKEKEERNKWLENHDDSSAIKAADGGFSSPVQITDFSKATGSNLDEMCVLMNSNSISLVSNCYGEIVDINAGTVRTTDNKLVSVDFTPEDSLGVSANVVLPAQYAVGDKNTVSFDIVNEGLLVAQGFEYKVTQCQGGKETTIINKDYPNVYLNTGDHYPVSFDWTVPADTRDMTLKIYVKEHNASGSENASVEVDVPYGVNLMAEDFTAELVKGKLLINSKVTNRGNLTSPEGNAAILIEDSHGNEIKTLSTKSIKSLASGENAMISEELALSVGDFNDYGMINLRLKVNAGDASCEAATWLAESKPVAAELCGGLESMSLNSGDTSVLTTAVGPWPGLVKADTRIIFYSSDNSIVSVTKEGQVRANAQGRAMLGVYYPEFGIGDSIDVTVSSGSGGSDSSGKPDKEQDTGTDKGKEVVDQKTKTDPKTGTVTQTTKYSDGSNQVVETRKDGTVITTDKDTAGNVDKTQENPDGSKQVSMDRVDGSSSTTTIDSTGRVDTQVILSEKAVENALKLINDSSEQNPGTPVQSSALVLPMPTVTPSASTEESPRISLKLPGNKPVKVIIPVEGPGQSTVLVQTSALAASSVVHTMKLTDGSTILTNAIPAENGISFKVSGDITVLVLDNAREFKDVPQEHWARSYVDFVCARELFNGVSDDVFGVDSEMSRGMLMTVLARMYGQDTSALPDQAWYVPGMEWAKNMGISDGSDPEVGITREQLAAMLYRYAMMQDQSISGTKSNMPEAKDTDKISDWAYEAMQWCTSNGILTGFEDGSLRPQEEATRAQVAAMTERFIKVLN